MAAAAASLAGETGNVILDEYLTFTLGDEEYGVDILKVQEIRGYDSVTRLPDSPPWIKGVINLRGTIVPVVDLRIRFRLGQPVYDAFTVMIILNVSSRVIGMVVDAVSDVTQLDPATVRPSPDLGAGMDSRFIAGMGTVEERMLILLDIERLMLSPEMALVDQDD
ncbi:chemotaxis protein CheW [Pseudomarimonas salicorniae]|uniref:Chemotaxis protein CheW n=1 Tax=Pseudomarimonas salicorniae TaxID=2933270 RepID=A0ABT0GL17_9GAMM|nr:chemotaxis protein CheW [Lysobacter sp. CAU 1642]MCK7595123.1 chemotaxis protein CheW [Lysobacter sp. CAU 1642]